jgi:hypothetical protein
VIYRLGIKKVGIIFLTLYREDSAYTERFGGFIQYIIDHRKEWIGDKAKRLEFLRNLRNWWYVEDWRSRGKDELARFFDWDFDLYDTEPFVTESIDYFIDNLLLNSGSWDRVLDPKGVSYFSPAKWYPRGKGTINYLCHNRKS